jgi:hypothetical protein
MKPFHLRQGCLNFAVFAALLLPGAAGATTIFSNLGALNVSSGSFGVNATTFAADSFMTGGASASMSDVILALEATPSASGTMTVSLFSSAGNTPTTNLATLGTIADNDSSLNTSTYTAYTVNVNGVILGANTQYFIVLSGSTTGTLDGRWENSNSNSGTGVAGQVHGENTTGSWIMQPNAGDFSPFVMQVDTGVATPEPGTFFGILGGLAAILVIRQHRRR